MEICVYLLLKVLLGQYFIYFILGLFTVIAIFAIYIAYHWDKAAKANIEMWHELNKGDSFEDMEPFYLY